MRTPPRNPDQPSPVVALPVVAQLEVAHLVVAFPAGAEKTVSELRNNFIADVNLLD